VNKHETAEVLGYLAAAFPNAKVTKQTAIVFHDVLSALPASDVMVAAKELVRECEFFPSPAQILNAVGRLSGTTSPSSGMAWQEVLRQVGEKGRMGVPEFSHATTEAVVKAIGWRDICMSENVDVLRSNFLRMYDGMAKSLDREALKELVSRANDALEQPKVMLELEG
jgi:hypothetical protein